MTSHFLLLTSSLPCLISYFLLTSYFRLPTSDTLANEYVVGSVNLKATASSSKDPLHKYTCISVLTIAHPDPGLRCSPLLNPHTIQTVCDQIDYSAGCGLRAAGCGLRAAGHIYNCCLVIRSLHKKTEMIKFILFLFCV